MAAIPGRYHDAHIKISGPGDARPTALQIIQDENLAGKLKGKVAVVTGTSSGIGVDTIRALYATGATVIATARQEAKLLQVIKGIEEEGEKNNELPVSARGTLIPVLMDLDSLASVRKGAQDILDKSHGKITYLICNAGVMACPQAKTQDGFEMQFGVCHLAHFLLFSLLKDALLAGSTPELNSRVVMVSSIGHQTSSVLMGDYGFQKTSYDPWVSYGQAKTANIWMANEIDRKFGSQGLHGLSLHPGGIMTELARHLGPEVTKAWDTPVAKAYMKSPDQGAATTVHAAVAKVWEGKGGMWLSNCEEVGPYGNVKLEPGKFTLGDDGYKEYAFDQEGAKKLWVDSCKMVGIPEY